MEYARKGVIRLSKCIPCYLCVKIEAAREIIQKQTRVNEDRTSTALLIHVDDPTVASPAAVHIVCLYIFSDHVQAAVAVAAATDSIDGSVIASEELHNEIQRSRSQ